MEPEKPDLKNIKFDLDSGFNADEIKRLAQYKLAPPSQILQATMDDDFDTEDYKKSMATQSQKLGSELGHLKKEKKKRPNNR